MGHRDAEIPPMLMFSERSHYRTTQDFFNTLPFYMICKRQLGFETCCSVTGGRSPALMSDALKDSRRHALMLNVNQDLQKGPTWL